MKMFKANTPPIFFLALYLFLFVTEASAEHFNSPIPRTPGTPDPNPINYVPYVPPPEDTTGYQDQIDACSARKTAEAKKYNDCMTARKFCGGLEVVPYCFNPLHKRLDRIKGLGIYHDPDPADPD